MTPSFFASIVKRRTWLQSLAVATSLIALSYLLFSFTLSFRLADDIWAQLGVSKQEAGDRIKRSFLENYMHVEGVRNAKNIALNNRAAVTMDLLQYTKEYLATPAFKLAYEKTRVDMKPVEPTGNQRSKEDIRKEKIAETKKLVDDGDAYMKGLTPQQQKNMQPVIDLRKKNLAAYQDPGSKEIEAFYQQQLVRRKSDLDNYQANLRLWDTDYPSDYRHFIKNRLQKYVDLAATVDFSATVTEKNGIKFFDNLDYQHKSNDWKMIYRAGREVYAVTKPFAEQWIKELN